nr:unnamed protein product [Haemonchus contortus]
MDHGFMRMSPKRNSSRPYGQYDFLPKLSKRQKFTLRAAPSTKHLQFFFKAGRGWDSELIPGVPKPRHLLHLLGREGYV